MRILNKIISFSIITALICTLSNKSIAFADDSQQQHMYNGQDYSLLYTIDSDNNIDIIKGNASSDGDGTIAIPDHIDGKPVTGIGGIDSDTNTSYPAFMGDANLTGVVIPNTVTSIGDNAFESCRNLSVVYIPDSVKSIGYNVFYYCSSLSNINMSNSITSIGKDAFGYCSRLNSITIPSAVTSIGDNAFEECKSLDSIEIPDTVTSMGKNVFYDCAALGSVKLPNKLTALGDNTFYGCQSLNSIEIPDTITTIGEGTFEGCTKINEFTLPKLLTSIGDGAFQGCSFSSIEIPDSVKSIGEGVFSYCTNLNNVKIPAGITEIGGGLFANCTSLDTITFPSSIVAIGSSAFSGCTGLKSIVIPDTVTEVDRGAFANCSNLSSVKISNSLQKIGDSMFYNCVKLKNITIPDSVDEIYRNAFSGCTSLSSITIPSKVTSIGYSAFGGCTGLSSIVLPNSITNIDMYAFAGCSSLKNMTIPGSVANIGTSTFFDDKPDYLYFKCNASAIKIDQSDDGVNKPQPIALPNVPIYYDSTDQGFGGSQWSGYTLVKADNGNLKTALGQNAPLDSTHDGLSTKSPKEISVNINSNTVNSITAADIVADDVYANIDFYGTDSSFSTEEKGAVNLKSDDTTSVYAKVTAVNGNSTYHKININYNIKPQHKITLATDGNGSVNVYGGTSGSLPDQYNAKEGTEVTISAKPNSGYNFDGWYNSSDVKVSGDSSYTFILGSDVAYTAKFVSMPKATLTVIAQGPGSVNIDNNPQASKEYLLGGVANLIAVPQDNAEFICWEDSNGRVLSSSATYSTAVSSDMSITALFAAKAPTSHLVTFEYPNGDVISSETVEKAAYTVTFPSNPYMYGYIFVGWDKASDDIQKEAGDVVVKSQFIKIPMKYTLTVNGGTGTGNYDFKDYVTVTAGDAPAGKKFSCWSDANGNAIAYTPVYKFYITSNICLTAQYIDAEVPAEEKAAITITNVTADTTNHKLTFVANRSIPDGSTVLSHGIILTSSPNPSKDTFIIGGSGVLQSKSVTTALTGTYVVNKGNVTSGQTWYARGYVIYKDANGNVLTVYSEIASQMMP